MRTWSRSTRSTGKQSWEALVYDGRAARAVRGCEGQDHPGHGRCPAYMRQKCFISAYDAATGKQVWKFDTVASDGEGGDSWGKNSTLSAPAANRITGSYDPATNLTYWGTAQAKPWMPVSRGLDALEKALFTSSTVALDVDTGKLAWHYPHAPGEALDLDVVFERLLVRFGRTEPCVHRRQGRHPLEARSQDRQIPRAQGDGLPERLGVVRPGHRRAALPPGILDAEVGEWVDGCPSTEGGHNWQAMSHHRTTNPLIIPLSQSCMRSRAADRAAAAAAAPAGGSRSTRCPAPTATSASSPPRRQQHEGSLVNPAADVIHDAVFRPLAASRSSAT